jgi:four helix bundle suffix protein
MKRGAREELIPAHGGYRKLKAYRAAEIVHDATVAFCDRFISIRSRTHDQMVQAARSGKQNIVEGSAVSGTSSGFELKLVGVARGSLEELLNDYQDFLRQHGLALWDKDDPRAQEVRNLAYQQDRSYTTYRTYIESSPAEVAANAAICLVHQAGFLIDKLKRHLAKKNTQQGGFSERLYRVRSAYRDRHR